MQNIKLSVSKVKCFLNCKKQFKYNYILKLPKKDREYHIFGKFLHRVLENFHKSYVDLHSTLPYNIEMGNAWRLAWSEYKSLMKPEMKKECYDILNNYLKLYTTTASTNNILALEKDFNFKLSDELNLIGMIDRVQIDDDGVLHVADYKSTKNQKYLKDDWFQLMTYGLIMLNENPNLKKIRVSYILLRHDFKSLTKEFSSEEILPIKDKYIEYANQMINEKDFAPNPTALCSYCDFLEHCVEGKTKSFNQNIYGEVSW